MVAVSVKSQMVNASEGLRVCWLKELGLQALRGSRDSTLKGTVSNLSRMKAVDLILCQTNADRPESHQNS